MAGALKFPPTKPKTSHKGAGAQLLCPGESGWALWQVWDSGASEGVALGEQAGPLLSGSRQGTVVVGLPLGQIYLFPLWLQTADAALVGDMVLAHLEKQGLASARAGETVFHAEVLLREEARTLVLVASLPVLLPDELILPKAESYDLAVRFRELPEDSLVLWRENGTLTVAATLGNRLVGGVALGEGSVTPSSIADLRCFLLAMEAQGVLLPIHRVVLWGSFTPAETGLLSQVLEVRCERADLPVPRLPQSRWNLVPQVVRDQAAVHLQTKQRRTLFGAAAAVYGLVLLVLLAQTGWLWFQVQKFQAKLSEQAPLVTSLRDTAARWDAVEEAVQPDFYVVEQLLHCAQSLPDEGVRLTKFETEGKRLLITGEAKNAPAAFKFAEDIKKQPFFASYRWQMAQPKLLANDSAQFQMEGNR
jgi:hypothetical protein